MYECISLYLRSYLFSVKCLLHDWSSFHFVVTTQPNKDPFSELVRNDFRSLITSISIFPPWISFCINCFVTYFGLFLWSFLDIFLMIVGITLSTHFKLINNELERAILFAESHSDFPHFSEYPPILEVNHIIYIII